jgi:hypothetical protein
LKTSREEVSDYFDKGEYRKPPKLLKSPRVTLVGVPKEEKRSSRRNFEGLGVQS